jgi:DNA-binding response OmpR family regulator
MKTILIIEDDESIAEVISLILADAHPYKILINSTGIIDKKLLSTSLDLILVDYLLPHTTGAEIIRSFRKSSKNAKTPIILMSANTERQLMRLAKQLDVEDTLPKPFDINNLVEKVNKILK